MTDAKLHDLIMVTLCRVEMGSADALGSARFGWRHHADALIEMLTGHHTGMRTAAADLERAAQSLMTAINAQHDAEFPDEARLLGREPLPLEAAMEDRSEAWRGLIRAIHYSKKARGAT